MFIFRCNNYFFKGYGNINNKLDEVLIEISTNQAQFDLIIRKLILYMTYHTLIRFFHSYSINSNKIN